MIIGTQEFRLQLGNCLNWSLSNSNWDYKCRLLSFGHCDAPWKQKYQPPVIFCFPVPVSDNLAGVQLKVIQLLCGLLQRQVLVHPGKDGMDVNIQ